MGQLLHYHALILSAERQIESGHLLEGARMLRSAFESMEDHPASVVVNQWAHACAHENIVKNCPCCGSCPQPCHTLLSFKDPKLCEGGMLI